MEPPISGGVFFPTSKRGEGLIANPGFRSRRVWARVAGLSYLLVMFVDLAGLQLSGQLLGKWLMVAGSFLVVPLALGLYFTLKIFAPTVSAMALACRLVEAIVGAIAAFARFETIEAAFTATYAGRICLELVAWNAKFNFDALIFTVGSTLFFFVFVRSVSIPKALGWLGLAASILAFGACAAHLLQPRISATSGLLWIPMLLAELSTGSWLLFRSVPDPPGRAHTL